MHIQTDRLGMIYPSGKTALEDISLDLKSPCLTGLLGPNGAGKTTLMKLLVAGLLPTSGSISFNGKPLQSREKELKSRLGYLPQDFGLFDELTVWQFLDYMSALKDIRDSKTAIQTVLQEVNLEAQQRTKIRALSGGQRQRVGIAQALLGNPELLIFDEPTVGLDPEERIHFRNLFSRAARNRIVLLSTHIIEDIQSICGQLIVIYQGRILFTGAPLELVRLAQGHVGVFEETALDEGTRVTARVNTARGVFCRMVAETLPDFAEPADPTLEDAYLYLISREVEQ